MVLKTFNYNCSYLYIKMSNSWEKVEMCNCFVNEKLFHQLYAHNILLPLYSFSNDRSFSVSSIFPRADVLVLREGASEPPRAAAVLLPASYLFRAGPGAGLAALCPQRTLAGALSARTGGRPHTPKVCSLTCVSLPYRCQFSGIAVISCFGLILFSCSTPAHTMKTGVLSWMKRELACSPQWLQVCLSVGSVGSVGWIFLLLRTVIILVTIIFRLVA